MSDSVRPQRRQLTRLPRPWDSPGKNTGVGCHFLLQCMKVKSESEVVQLCPTPLDPMDCSLPGSSFHGIFQARVLEWSATAFSIVLNFLYSSFKGAIYTIRSGVAKMLLLKSIHFVHKYPQIFFPSPYWSNTFSLSVSTCHYNVSFLTYYRWDDQNFQV